METCEKTTRLCAHGPLRSSPGLAGADLEARDSSGHTPLQVALDIEACLATYSRTRAGAPGPKKGEGEEAISFELARPDLAALMVKGGAGIAWTSKARRPPQPRTRLCGRAGKDPGSRWEGIRA